MMLRDNPIRRLAVVVAMSVSVVATPATAAPEVEASTPAVEHARAVLVIDTTELGEGGPPMSELIGLLEQRVLRERGVGPAMSDTDPRIIVVIRPLSDDAGLFDHRVDISIEQDGQAWDDSSWGFDCDQCTDGYFLNKVALTLHSAVTRLESEFQRPVAASDEIPENRPIPGEEPQPDDGKPVRVGPLVWVGGAVAIVGALGVVVGIPVAMREDQIIGDMSSDRRQKLQTRTPGWITTGIGASALVTGGALLALGLTRWSRQKRARRSASGTNINITPWAAPGRLGLSLHRRF